jgi:hypothetical protein
MQLLDWTVTRDCVTSDTALVFKLGSALYNFSLSFGTLWTLNPAWLQNPGLGINNANHDGGIITFDNCLIRATWFSSIQIVLPTDPHHIFANRDWHSKWRPLQTTNKQIACEFRGNYREQRKLVEIGESIDKGEDDAPQNIITEKGIGRITMGDCQYQLKRGNLSFFH